MDQIDTAGLQTVLWHDKLSAAVNFDHAACHGGFDWVRRLTSIAFPGVADLAFEYCPGEQTEPSERVFQNLAISAVR